MLLRIHTALRRRLALLSEARANARLSRHLRRAGCQVESNCRFFGTHLPLLNIAGTARFGRNVSLQGTAYPIELQVARGATFTICSGSILNQGATIAVTTEVFIGPDCGFGEHVAIHDTSFHDIAPDRPKRSAPVRFGRNVWLGHRAIVLPGVEIGDHSVVGAGAVVTKSLPARCIAVGVPARVVGTFECPDNWKRF
jgi:acetyltransferase-like isoleucine patch superfamily enzyme